MSKQTNRLWLSATVATLFYGAWSLFANSLVTDDTAMLIRSALVQGFYSGFVTLFFTWLLESAYCRSATKYISFAFVVPLVCLAHHDTKHAKVVRKTFNDILDATAGWFSGLRWPAAILAPLAPLAIQSLLVIGVNLLNQTPNLALTVSPSIFFSGLYGYLYTFALMKSRN